MNRDRLGLCQEQGPIRICHEPKNATNRNMIGGQWCPDIFNHSNLDSLSYGYTDRLSINLMYPIYPNFDTLTRHYDLKLPYFCTPDLHLIFTETFIPNLLLLPLLF